MSRFFRYDPDSDSVVERNPEEPAKPMMAPGKGWPRTCWASGVGANQAQELRDLLKSHGETVEVNNSGDPIYTSQHQRERCLKIRGMHDKRSFN